MLANKRRAQIAKPPATQPVWRPATCRVVGLEPTGLNGLDVAMKAIKPSLAWPPSVPSSAAAQLLELSFSVLSMLAPFFVTFFPSLQPATKTQDLHAFAGVAPSTDALLPSLDQLAAPPLLPEPEQLGPTGFSAVADAPWTCAQQRATGLLMPRYPCGGSALEQVKH